MLKSLLSLALLSSLFTIGYQMPAEAQYSDRQEKRNSKSLFRRDFYVVNVFNIPSESESDFTIRYQSYGEVSGCAEMSKARVELKETLDNIKIEARDAEPRVQKRDPRYTNYDCDIKTNRAYFDVKLNRDELIEKGIKTLGLQSARYGEFATSELDVSEKKIDILTKTEESENLITFWFHPENTVILTVPKASADINIQKEIKDFAKTLGLTPIEDYFNDGNEERKYELPYTAKHYAVFLDAQNVYADKVSANQESIKIGELELMRDFYTAQGKTQQPYKVDVQLSIPSNPFPDQ